MLGECESEDWSWEESQRGVGENMKKHLWKGMYKIIKQLMKIL